MKPTDKEDLQWFAEFATGCEHGTMTMEELLGLALIHAITDREDVQALFDSRREDHEEFCERFERLTGLEFKHEDTGWCFFSCSC